MLLKSNKDIGRNILLLFLLIAILYLPYCQIKGQGDCIYVNYLLLGIIYLGLMTQFRRSSGYVEFSTIKYANAYNKKYYNSLRIGEIIFYFLGSMGIILSCIGIYKNCDLIIKEFAMIFLALYLLISMLLQNQLNRYIKQHNLHIATNNIATSPPSTPQSSS